jgi:hypothetical protein
MASVPLYKFVCAVVIFSTVFYFNLFHLLLTNVNNDRIQQRRVPDC